MAYIYDIAPNAGDSHQIAPYWLAAVIRFKYRDTLDRNSIANQVELVVSKNEALANPTLEDGAPLIITSDIVNWSVSSSKSSHTSSLQMTVEHTDTDYLVNIAPEDWIFFWAFDNKGDYDVIRRAVNDGKAANHFTSGLKFMGRVDSIRKVKSRDPQTGRLTGIYNFNCIGFSEFDSLIYYNPLLAQTIKNMDQYMSRLGKVINDVVATGGVSIQNQIPTLLNVFLGEGLLSKGITEEALSGFGNLIADASDAITKGFLRSTPNQAFRIPPTAAKLLGMSGKNYSDIITATVGVQVYDGSGFEPKLSDLDGDTLPNVIDFSKKTVWSILGSYLNDPINEMYTTLRVTGSGDQKTITPHFICRKLPLSSPEFVRGHGYGTNFLTLPRWRISDAMIHSIDVGRSNAARFNWVCIQSQDKLKPDQLASKAYALQVSPPSEDTADILRSGLRMYDRTVTGTNVLAAEGGPNSRALLWGRMMADILMGGHLKYSGTVATVGIQDPIAIGDNAEVDGVIYHIEGVHHMGSIDVSGRRTFMTTLQLSNGLSASSEDVGRTVYPDTTETALEGVGVDVFSELKETTKTVPVDRHLSTTKE
jgi:hypothetical protein